MVNIERRVVITGIGMICSLGENIEEVLDSLVKNKIGIGKTKLLEKYKELKYIMTGDCNLPIYDIADVDSTEKIEIMVRKAIDEVMLNAKLTIDDLKKKGDRVALSFSSSLVGNTQMIKALEDKNRSEIWCLYSRQFVSKLMKKYNIKGSVYTTTSACAAGTAGIALGYDLIKSNEADIVLVGGADYLCEFTIFGFNSLKSLSKGICKPFDDNRDGLNIGEASVFFIFEEINHAKNRGVEKYYGEILGYGLANEAYHMTSPNPSGEGATFAMEMAIKEAGINPEDIDYINAHGTGTRANDIMELNAIRSLFNENTYVSSIKSRTGHCLGAAGSVELACSLLAINSNYIPTTLNSKLDIEGGEKYLYRKNSNKKVKYFLSNSFAFAGNIASVLIKTN